MRLRYVMIAEGSSDAGLGPILERLCVRAGATEVQDVTPDLSLLRRPPGKELQARLDLSLRLEPSTNLIFLHRDANGVGRAARLQEMAEAMERAGGGLPWVPVVPCRMLESWLLVDESAIREVAGNSRGRVALGLPPLNQVEGVHNAKERLRDTLLVASEQAGRRREQLRQEFPSLRHALIDRMNPEGPLAQLESWRQLVQDIEEVLRGWVPRSARV